jgi:hypothetical protein
MVNDPVLREVVRLPFSTAECDVGPITEHRPGLVTIRYDAEGEGGVIWTTLSFTAALTMRFTPDLACSAWMVEAYSKVCEVEDSDWIRDLQLAAANHSWELRAGSRHFFVYFDHIGCWEILADEVAVGPSSA